MTPEQKKPFFAIYSRLCVFYRQKMDEEIAEMWWQLAVDVALEDFGRAALQHMKTEKFMPQLSELLERIRASKWPSPEQAWNMLPKSEAEGGWMCQEMATAMGAAQDSIDRGDLVAARMAFLESYKRELQTTTERGPTWWLSEPNSMTYETLLNWRNAMLAQHPNRRPKLTEEMRSQLELMTGSGRTTSGLAKLSENIGSIVPAKSLSRS